MPPAAKKRRYAPRVPTERRREQLLDAALRIVARDGYEKVSIEAIARETGVSRPVVYAAYDDLDALLEALLDRTQRRALRAALDLLPDRSVEIDIVQWLLDTLTGLLDVVRQDPDAWRPILGLSGNVPAVVSDRIESTRALIRGYAADTIEAGLERRGLDMNPRILAHLAISIAEEFARLALATPQRYRPEDLVQTIEQLLRTELPPA